MDKNQIAMCRRLWIVLLSAVLITSCAEKPDTARDTLAALQEVGELSLQELTYTKILADKGNKYLRVAGEKKYVFTMTAYVEVGVDLKESYDVWTNKSTNSVRLLLPPVKRLSYTIPINAIVPEYSRLSGLRAQFSAEDREQMYKDCESKMLADIDKEIADNADVYEGIAVQFFESLFSTLGFENVIVEFKANDNLDDDGE